MLSNSPQLDSSWLKSQSLHARFEHALGQSYETLDEFEQAAFSILEDDTFCGNDPLVTEQGQVIN